MAEICTKTPYAGSPLGLIRAALGAAFFCLWLVSAGMPVSAQQSLAPAVAVVEDLSGGFGPVSGPRVASMNARKLAIAWTVEEGGAEGVYVRRRENFLWEAAPLRIPGTEKGAPRDLALLYDRRGTIHLFWTQLAAGNRRVFHAAAGTNSDADLPRELPGSGEGDADYPQAAYRFDEDRFVVAWQSSQATSHGIGACLVDGVTGVATALASPSGALRSAMTPQILDGPHPLIAYYVVLESDNDLRAAELTDEGAWAPAVIPGINSSLPYRSQPLFASVPGAAAFAYWHDESETGGSAIAIARQEKASDEALSIERLDQPAGEHRMPQMSAPTGGSFTICWQALSAGQRSIELADVNWITREKRAVKLSPDLHEHAAEPHHETRAPYTFAVWTDDARTGGTGALGFAEVQWIAAGFGSGSFSAFGSAGGPR